LGLVRSEVKARLLKERRITPVLGTLDEAAILTGGARQADPVINAANTERCVIDLQRRGGGCGRRISRVVKLVVAK
jgi:hypothetical protein